MEHRPRIRPRMRTTAVTLTTMTGALVGAAAITPGVDVGAAVLVAVGVGALIIRGEMRHAEQAAAAQQLASWARTRLMSAAEDRRRQLAAIADLRGEARDWEGLWGATNRQARQVLDFQADVTAIRPLLELQDELAEVRREVATLRPLLDLQADVTLALQRMDKICEGARYAAGWLDGSGGKPPSPEHLRGLREIDWTPPEFPPN